jgi:DNA-binding LacI/PurR family transcriptional regulator
MKKKKKMSINDVAKHAGVSIATVSRYFNGAEKVSVDARKKIIEAAKELNYRSGHSGFRGSNLIAFVIRDIANPNYYHFFKTAEVLADTHGYFTAFHNGAMSQERERKLFNYFVNTQASGVVIFTVTDNDKNLSILEQGGIPVVLIDSVQTETHINVLANLVTNVYSGAYSGTTYLLNIGHRNIAFLTGPKNTYTAETRLKGYLDALRDFDSSIEPQYYHIPFSEEAGYTQTVQILLQKNGTTAIFPASNQLTTGCFLALQDYNINVPRQISLLGFDDIGHTRLYNPPLTVVSRPHLHRVGFAAVSILLNYLENRENAANVSLDVPMEILVRLSCAPPAAD